LLCVVVQERRAVVVVVVRCECVWRCGVNVIISASMDVETA
jgi:hypothetical protein